MSLCPSCKEVIQSAAKCSVAKKVNELQRGRAFRRDSQEKIELQSDPFVVMWVPEPPRSKPKDVFSYQADPNCTEYDYTYDMITGSGKLYQRLHLVSKRVASRTMEMTTRQIDLCPPCATKIQLFIYQILEDVGKSRHEHPPEPRPPERRLPNPLVVQCPPTLVIDPRELEKLLAYLPYIVPICPSCQNMQKIYLITLPSDVFHCCCQQKPKEIKQPPKEKNQKVRKRADSPGKTNKPKKNNLPRKLK